MTDRASLPDSELPATRTQRFQVPAFSGHPAFAGFYPRVMTSGFTDGGARFRDLDGESMHAGQERSRISRDSAASHEKFERKMSVPPGSP